MSDNNGGDKRRGREDGGGGGKGGGGKKAKYFQKAGMASSSAMPHGQAGILITCDSHFEYKAGKEALMLIEEHYDKLQGNRQAPAAAAAASASGTKDISALLAEEVAGLKDKKKQRFRYHDTGVKGCIFVVLPEEPGPTALEVVLSVLQEAKATKTLRARHCHRMLPITHSCFCSMEHIKEIAPKVLEGHFPTGEGVEGIPFSVEYEHRSAEKFDRMEIIDIFAQQISCPPHVVSLKAPVKSVLVQLTRNACGLCVVTQYRELARFNIRKLTEPEEDEAGAGAGEAAAAAAAKAGAAAAGKVGAAAEVNAAPVEPEGAKEEAEADA